MPTSSIAWQRTSSAVRLEPMAQFEHSTSELSLAVKPARAARWSLPVWLHRELSAHLRLYAVWLVWFIGFALLVRSTLGGPDGTRYMSYIRSLVFDHDLLLTNELQYFGERVIVTATGYAAQIANVGVLPFWLPFYLLGLLVNALRGNVGSGLANDYALWLD